MNERKWELDIVRIIACMMVVIIHVAGYGMEIMDPATLDWQVRNLVVSLARCSVPIFFMMSGVLFLNRELSIKALYKRYVSHILVVWIIWSSFYALIDYIAYLKNGNASITFFLERFFLGHYHLWFLPSLLVAYVMYPLLYRIVRICEKDVVLYLGIVVLVGIIFKETLDPFLVSSIWENIWTDIVAPESAVGIIYFVLGYYLYKKVDLLSRKWWITIYIFSGLLVGIINWGCSLYYREPLSVTYGYLNLGVLIASVSAFSFMVQRFRLVRLNSIQKVIIKEVSECTMGIYLIHTFLIEQVFRRVGLTQGDYPVFISIVLFFVLSFSISLAIIWCIRRIPIARKWMV